GVEEDCPDQRVRCSIHRLDDDLIDDLREVARGQNVTLNDLFLAAIAEACDRENVTPRARGRQEIALGTVVDLRPSCTQNLTDVFGLFLGFTTVVVRPTALQRWDDLVRSVATQTALHKRCNLAQPSLLRMAVPV